MTQISLLADQLGRDTALDRYNNCYNHSKVTLTHPRYSRSGTTLVETVIAATLVAAFFATIFEVNAVCLRYIEASKESVSALQGVQDRVEVLRSLLFTDLTNSTYLQNLMVNPGNGQPCGTPASDCSDFVINKVTEVVTLSAYPTPDGTNTQITRGPGASVTPTINSTDANLANAKLVRLNVTYKWTTTFGGRKQTDPITNLTWTNAEQTETIISAGTKK